MLKNIRKLLITLGLVFVITISIFSGIGSRTGKVAYANGNNTYTTTQQQKADLKEVKDVLAGITIGTNGNEVKAGSRGKILLYSSHSCEKNKEASIIEISENLSQKLEKKGFIVEHDKSLFANEQGYNRSYYSSGAMLDAKKLSEYVLVCDIHMDAATNPISTEINGKEVARLMFPNLSQNPNLKAETRLVEKIKEGLDSFGGKIFREQTTKYKKGINYYSLNKSPNILLIEVGGNMNDKLSAFRSCTYLSSAISEAIK